MASSYNSFNNQFAHAWQVIVLKIETFVILFAYIVMFFAILDTMRLHEIFSLKSVKSKSLNLYLFYILSILVCICRWLSLVSLFAALQTDDKSALDYYNYGYYSATFCIVLIAISEVNSISTTTLRLRFLNLQIQGPEAPPQSYLKRQLRWLNAANTIIDLITLIYFSISMARLFDYYQDPLGRGAVLTNLNDELGYFIGGMMLACSLTIIATYYWMQKTFRETYNLRSSNYRQSMQRGFLVIAIVYVIRSVYSLMFQMYRQLKWNRFYLLSAQTNVILLLDAPAILVILYINRKTIRLRKRFAEEGQRRENANTYHNLRAADFYYAQGRQNLEPACETSQGDQVTQESMSRNGSMIIQPPGGVATTQTESDLALDDDAEENKRVAEFIQREYDRMCQEACERVMMTDMEPCDLKKALYESLHETDQTRPTEQTLLPGSGLQQSPLEVKPRSGSAANKIDFFHTSLKNSMVTDFKQTKHKHSLKYTKRSFDEFDSNKAQKIGKVHAYQSQHSQNNKTSIFSPNVSKSRSVRSVSNKESHGQTLGSITQPPLSSPSVNSINEKGDE